MASVGDDLLQERRAVRSTLAEVGPDAPTACGTWTATDVAVHLVSGEVVAAVPNTPFRWLVAHGLRLDRMASLNERALTSYRRRHDFEWALRRLDRPAPWLHRQGVVAAVSLLEYWAHHEDVLAANDAGPCRSGVDLAPVLMVLTRYQRVLLNTHAVRVTSAGSVWHEPKTAPRVIVDGADEDIARWLAGRGSLDALGVSGDPDTAASLASERPRI